LVNLISSSMVGEHDDFNDDLTCILCLPHERFQKIHELMMISHIFCVYFTKGFEKPHELMMMLHIFCLYFT
jgi:hypothetical protein